MRHRQCWFVFMFALLALLAMFSEVSRAANFVYYCGVNPGDGVSCPSGAYVSEGSAIPAGKFFVHSPGTTFQGYGSVRYLSIGAVVGLALTPVCRAVALGDCSTGASGAYLYWDLVSVRDGGYVVVIGSTSVASSGQFALQATQDVVFALGVVLCGLVGISLGVRLL